MQTLPCELVQRFSRDLASLAGEAPLRFGVAVSGGPDSLALLLLAQAARPGAIEAAQSLTSGAPNVSFGSWLISLIPTNPVNAAANGAMLPLILFTLFFALAIGKAPAAARTTLLGFFSAVTETMLVLVRWVVRLAPIGIFGLMVPLGAHGGVGLAGAIGFYVVAYSAASVLFVLLLYPALKIFVRLPMRVFARAALPAQLIAFSSSSSIASLPALVEGAEERLKLPKEVTAFVLPLAVSMFKFAGPVAWPLGSLFVAWFYGVELHMPQYLTIAFAAIFLGFAGPGVPRGAFLILAPLFLAIGLPLEGIGILIAVDAIPDLFATVTNSTGDLAATVLVARFSVSSEGRSRLSSPQQRAISKVP